MLERLGNVIYWLCLVAAVVLVIVGSMTFAAIGGQITQTWTIFGGWALVAAATYGVWLAGAVLHFTRLNAAVPTG
jgi:hypothetical protein